MCAHRGRGPHFGHITRVRASLNAALTYTHKHRETRVNALRSVSTTRVYGPSSRAENSGRELGPRNRIVETDLYSRDSQRHEKLCYRITAK